MSGLKRTGAEAPPIRSAWDLGLMPLVAVSAGKVSSVVRQDLEPGEEPAELPLPRGLQGVARRPIPIGSAQRPLKSELASEFRKLEQRVLERIAASGLLDEVAADAAGYILAGGGKSRAKGPVGRGRPLGPENRRRVGRVWNRRPVKAIAELIEEEIDAWAVNFDVGLQDSYKQLYDVGGRGAQRQLGVRPNFELRNPHVLEQLGKRANLLTGGVSQDVFNRLRTVIAEDFYLKGQNPLDVAASLRSEFSWLSKARSETIARTETLAVTSEATQTLHQASGVKLKRWLTTLDGRERQTHFEAHGQMVKIGEEFSVGSAKLKYPGDSSTSDLGEIINCRCSTIPVILPNQQFSGSTVWNGENAPDQFARERASLEAACWRRSSSSTPARRRTSHG